jgi:SAM-dependent methyltransferase
MTRYNSHETPDQVSLWDKQHATRGANLEGSEEYKFTPNTSAIEFAKHLKPKSSILEIGSANGRDARYWADNGHNVYAVDFSQVALDQLKYLAMEQGVIEFVSPILHDISHGTLPLAGIPNSIDGFYARSALHIDDTQLYKFAFELNTILKPGAIIFIEGKGPNDKKIARSEPIGKHLVIDHEEEGHVRRVWTCQFSHQLCETMKWDILDLKDRHEKWNGTPATFMRLIAQKGHQNA